MSHKLCIEIALHFVKPPNVTQLSRCLIKRSNYYCFVDWLIYCESASTLVLSLDFVIQIKHTCRVFCFLVVRINGLYLSINLNIFFSLILVVVKKFKSKLLLCTRTYQEQTSSPLHIQ